MNQLQNSVLEIGNPFEEDLYSLDTKDVVEAEHALDILDVAPRGAKQHKSFFLRLRDCEEKSAFCEPMKKNKFRLFNLKQKPDSSEKRRKI